MAYERRRKTVGFEYEGLFDSEWNAGPDDLLSGYWQNVPSAIRVGKMGYRTRTVKAGPRLEAEVYPIFGRETEKRLRAARANITPAKMQKLNMERSRRHFILLVDGNFTDQDIHLTLTYKQAPDYERAQKDVRNFLNKVKRLRKKLGLPELKYAGTIEGNTEGRKQRIHVHLLMNGGIDRETLEKMWARGYANADRLKPDENGLEAVARYIIKQQKNRKKWFASRNLKQPVSRTSDTKMSNGRVKRLAMTFPNEAKEIMEKTYPGYMYVKSQVYYSDMVDGFYIRAVLRKRSGEKGGGAR